MKKLALFSTILLVLALGFSFSPILAANNDMGIVGNAIGNAAEGAKNVVEGAITGTENIVEKGANSVKNTADDMMNVSDSNTKNYTAMKTSTGGQTTIAGMTATTWTWIIVAILGALIIALVYYYANQNTASISTSDSTDE